jgi:hypothetical protein
MTTTFYARSPEDVLAVVPVVLGFEPSDSIVLLTFGGMTRFHARVDLPPPGDPGALDEVCAMLLEPCLRHRVPRVLLVLYSDQPRHARTVARRLRRELGRRRIEVLDCLRADGQRWYAADGRRSDVPVTGLPYDAAAHPFRAQAVMAGHVTLGSREELAAQVAPDRAAAARVTARLTSATALGAEQVAALVRRHAAAGTVPDDAELAALLLAIGSPPVRDAAWVGLSRADAEAHVALWCDAVRRAPDELAGDAAAVLGLMCWLAGHGALAWCALDRCVAVTPRHSLGSLVAELLRAAISPAAWEASQAAPAGAADLEDVWIAARADPGPDPEAGVEEAPG